MDRHASALRRILNSTCFIYTVVSVALLLCGVTFSKNLPEMELNALRFLLVFPFSLSISLLNFLRLEIKLPSGVGFLIHFVGTVTSFFVFLCLPAQKDSNPASAFIMILLISLAYLALHLFRMLVTRKSKKSE